MRPPSPVLLCSCAASHRVAAVVLGEGASLSLSAAEVTGVVNFPSKTSMKAILVCPVFWLFLLACKVSLGQIAHYMVCLVNLTLFNISFLLALQTFMH